jgi:general stress protein YciG
MCLQKDRTSQRGFASMDRARQREIARMGGRASHEKGKAHQFTPEEARAAGRKGGEMISRNRQHMAEIGRRGGMRRGQAAAARAQETSTTPQAAE